MTDQYNRCVPGDRADLYRREINQKGKEAQTVKAIRHLSKLSSCLARRLNGEPHEELLSELAETRIMLEQIESEMFGTDPVDIAFKEKFSELENRVMNERPPKAKPMTDRIRYNRYIPEYRTDVYRQAIDRWGEEAQTAKAIEEFGELTTCLARRLNGQQPHGELLLELADARIMLEQIESEILNSTSVDAVFKEKIHELENRIFKQNQP